MSFSKDIREKSRERSRRITLCGVRISLKLECESSDVRVEELVSREAGCGGGGGGGDRTGKLNVRV